MQSSTQTTDTLPVQSLADLQERQSKRQDEAKKNYGNPHTQSGHSDPCLSEHGTGSSGHVMQPLYDEGYHIARGNLYDCPDWAWAALSERSRSTAFMDILRFTKDIVPLSDPSIVNVHNCLIDSRHNPDVPLPAEFIVYHAIIKAPNNPSITKQVIGLNGHYFHLTTENYGLLYIWHHRPTSSFHFWGSNYINVINAVDVIKDRIYKKSFS